MFETRKKLQTENAALKAELSGLYNELEWSKNVIKRQDRLAAAIVAQSAAIEQDHDKLAHSLQAVANAITRLARK